MINGFGILPFKSLNQNSQRNFTDLSVSSQGYALSESIVITTTENLSYYASDGDGKSWETAWIIENLLINLNFTSNNQTNLYETKTHSFFNGIYIENINDYVICRNVEINIYTEYSPDWPFSFGVYILNSTNIRLDNIVINDFVSEYLSGFTTGIYIFNCSNIVFDHNITITNCGFNFVLERVVNSNFKYLALNFANRADLSINFCHDVQIDHFMIQSDSWWESLICNSSNIVFANGFWKNPQGKIYFGDSEEIIFRNNRIEDTKINFINITYLLIDGNICYKSTFHLEQCNLIHIISNKFLYSSINHNVALEIDFSQNILISTNLFFSNEFIFDIHNTNGGFLEADNLTIKQNRFIFYKLGLFVSQALSYNLVFVNFIIPQPCFFIILISLLIIGNCIINRSKEMVMLIDNVNKVKKKTDRVDIPDEIFTQSLIMMKKYAKFTYGQQLGLLLIFMSFIFGYSIIRIFYPGYLLNVMNFRINYPGFKPIIYIFTPKIEIFGIIFYLLVWLGCIAFTIYLFRHSNLRIQNGYFFPRKNNIRISMKHSIWALVLFIQSYLLWIISSTYSIVLIWAIFGIMMIEMALMIYHKGLFKEISFILIGIGALLTIASVILSPYSSQTNSNLHNFSGFSVIRWVLVATFVISGGLTALISSKYLENKSNIINDLQSIDFFENHGQRRFDY